MFKPHVLHAQVRRAPQVEAVDAPKEVEGGPGACGRERGREPPLT